MAKYLNLVYIPHELVKLSLEVSNHPELMEKLKGANTAIDDWEIRLSIIATHCNVLLDGVYDQDAIVKLADILAGRLEAKRSKLILPISSGIH